MIEFTLNMPGRDAPYSVATVRVLDGFTEFLSEAVFLGYTPPAEPEKRGLTFNTECSKTGDKHAIILLNRRWLDHETILHEVRHAYFWVMSNQHGIVKVDVLNDVEEERFCSCLDTLINRAICTLEARFGEALKWKRL